MLTKPATTDASALIGAALDRGDGYFSTYRYALTVGTAHMKELRDINILHKTIMRGMPASAESSPGRHNLLFATSRSAARRTKGYALMTAGAPHKIVAQAPFPLDWRPLLAERIITDVQEAHIEQVWEKKMQCRIRAELYPSQASEGRRRRLTTSHEQGEWLRQKMGAGAHIEPHDIKIGNAENLTSARGVRFIAYLFTAHVTVTDPAAFAAILTQGVGKGRAYGLGLVLASRTVTSPHKGDDPGFRS